MKYTQDEIDTAKLACSFYRRPDSDIEALIHFERHRKAAAQELGMSGLTALASYIAGFHAGRNVKGKTK